MNLLVTHPPVISIVVISTHAANLTANLQAVVEAAEAIESAELILVCQGYRPDLSFLLTNLPVRVLFSASLMGISRARNAGADHSQGQFISFLDDDIQPDPHFYQLTVSALLDHPERVGVLGALQVNGNIDAPLFCKFRRHGASRLRRFDLWRLANGNTGVFLRTGLRFDSRLGVGANFGSFEDADYFLAAERLGALAFMPEAILFHPNMIEEETRETKRMCQYGRGLGGCLRKNGGLSGAFFFVASLLNNLLMFFRLQPYATLSARWAHMQAAGAKFIGWLQWRSAAPVYVAANDFLEILDSHGIEPSIKILGDGS